MELPTWTNGITDVLRGVRNVTQAQRAELTLIQKYFVKFRQTPFFKKMQQSYSLQLGLFFL